MKLRVLTPLHIGTGEEIIPWEYRIANGKVGIYPVEYLVKELTRQQHGQRLRNTLIQLRNEVRDRGFSENLGNFLDSAGLRIGPMYSLSLKTQLKQGNEFKSIKDFIKQSGRVYIPGSEIKGALRTIFMFGIVREELRKGNNRYVATISKIIKNTLDNPDPKDKNPWKTAHSKIENMLMRDRTNKDAKYDIFKALIVSDSEAKPPEEVLYVDGVHIIGSRKTFNEPHELVREGVEFEFSLKVDDDIKKALKKSSKNPNIDLLSIEFLHENAKAFYEFLLKEDSEFYKNKNEDNAFNTVYRIYDENKKGKFLLRLGKHQGFLSLTIMLLLKLTNKELYERFYGEIISEPDKEPNKTRKLTGESKPLGWCEIVY